MKDIIEQMEDSAEFWAEKLNMNYDSVDCCNCKKRCKLSEVSSAYDSPYAPPICPNCVDEIYFKNKDK